MTSTASDNELLIRQYLDALSGQPKPAGLLDRFVSDANLVEHVRQVESAFPCYEMVADDMIAERDLVAVRGAFRGIHRASFAGIAPTGRRVSVNLMIIYRIADGRIAEHWLQVDTPAMLAQLGAGSEVSASR